LHAYFKTQLALSLFFQVAIAVFGRLIISSGVRQAIFTVLNGLRVEFQPAALRRALSAAQHVTLLFRSTVLATGLAIPAP
jgi:hypothetical protein